MSIMSRWQNRKRGVSIENVMLGLIVVIIFAGMLYGAFTVVNRSLNYSAFSRVASTLVLEAKMIVEEDKRNGRADSPDYMVMLSEEARLRGAIPQDAIFEADGGYHIGHPGSGISLMMTYDKALYSGDDGPLSNGGHLVMLPTTGDMKTFGYFCTKFLGDIGLNNNPAVGDSTFYNGFNMALLEGGCDPEDGALILRLSE